MQVLISSTRPSKALRANSGSASIGRPMEVMSAIPSSSTCSATAGMLMRLLVIRGIDSSRRRRPVTGAKAARGTRVAIVGTRAWCHTKCVLMIVAPAASTALARLTTSSQLLPSSIISIAAMR
jgi:hypothetical protein